MRDTSPQQRPRPRLHHLASRAMNCDMASWVFSADQSVARARLQATRQFMHRVEARLRRFRPQSELSRLNARTGEAVPVSSMLWEVIGCALQSSCHTGGLYDPTILDALETAGYDRTFQAVVDDQRLPGSESHRHIGWREIRRDSDAQRVTLPPGVRLDPGGIAKAWAADRAADRLARLGPCLVDAGGDIAVHGRPMGTTGWTVGVADPLQADTDLAVLVISDRGVATSGIAYRRWRRGGMVQHHIIDPRFGRPAETDLLTATVVASSAIQADVHALTTLIFGAQRGSQYLRSQQGVEGLLVCSDGSRLATPGFIHEMLPPRSRHASG